MLSREFRVAPFKFLRLVVLLLPAIVMLGGCSQPTVAPANLRLTATLRTAISAHNETWLEKNATLVAERFATGQMSRDEHDRFVAIIEQARSGDWERAERAVVRLQAAQVPTAEQVRQVTRHNSAD